MNRDGAAVAAAAFRAFPHDELVVHWAAGVLSNLSLDKASVERVAATGARALCLDAVAHFAVGSGAHTAANELLARLPAHKAAKIALPLDPTDPAVGIISPPSPPHQSED
jgi:hypothetical protein